MLCLSFEAGLSMFQVLRIYNSYKPDIISVFLYHYDTFKYISQNQSYFLELNICIVF